MKILHICLCGPVTDGWSYQDNLLPKYHVLLGHEVSIIASEWVFDDKGKIIKTYDLNYINEDNVKMIRLKSKYHTNINSKFRHYSKLSNALKQEEPDIIFVHGCHFLGIKDICKYKQRNKSVTIYVDNHADFLNSATNWLSKHILHKIIWKHYAQMIEPYAKKFYGVLPARVDFLVNMYNLPREKVELLVMGADDDKLDFDNRPQIRKDIRLKLDIGMDDFVIITGGKITRRKNTHLLLQAMNEIDNDKIKLIVFGSCDNEMRSEINWFSNKKNIRNIGWISADDQYNYFFASDLAAFPGTHSVLWEQAVGAGLPCLFKKWDGMQHVDVGGNCLFLTQDSYLEIKQSILKLYDNQDLYNTLKNVAIQIGISQFSYAEISRRSIQFDKEIEL